MLAKKTSQKGPMQAIKHLLSSILIITVLASGLPFFSPQDANRDTRINLEDAILHVKGFARTAEEPGTFRSHVEKAVSTLHVVSGLKAVIKQTGDTKSTTTLPALDFPYLISSNDLLLPLNNFSQFPEKPFFYSSISITPTSPPPRKVSA